MEKKSALNAAICLALMISSEIGTAETQKNLIRNAIATFEQRKPDVHKLRKAAETGSKEAQFYFAETLRLSSGHMTTEARLWYERSAEQGDMYSLYRLSKLSKDACTIIGNCSASSASSKVWGDTVIEIARRKSEQGDGQAMEMMYVLTGNLDWLLKSATSGYPSAQYWLAIRYGRGDGWFFWPGQRQKEIESLYKASAEGGYPKAISQYAGMLLLRGDIENAQKWLMKGVAISYAPAIGTYAFNLEHGKYYHFEKNLTLAYSFYLILSEIGAGESDAAIASLDDLEHQVSPQQRAEAAQLANAWKAVHPPASYYPHKLESH